MAMKLGKDLGQQEIDRHIDDAYTSIRLAQEIADENDLTFEFSLRYGMGGTYFPVKPKKMTRQEAISLLESGKDLTSKDRTDIVEALNEDSGNNSDWHSSSDNVGWVSSSDQC